MKDRVAYYRVKNLLPGKREFIGACSRQVHACKIGAVQLYIRCRIFVEERKRAKAAWLGR